MRQWWNKLRAFLTGRQALADDLREELQSHLEMEIEDDIGRGLSPDAARHAVLRRFGNRTSIQERAVETWAIRWLDSLLRDIRYGARTLRRTPGLTISAVLSLALGMGANTAIFSAADALIFHTLPLSQPEQLVVLRMDDPWHDTPGYGMPYPMLERSNELRRFFSAFAGEAMIDRSNMTLLPRHPDAGTAITDSEPAHVNLVSGNYFSLLGVPAAMGRTFTPGDDRVQGGHPLAIISHRYWQRKLGGDRDVIGRALSLNGTTYTIVGIMPRSFAGLWIGRPTDIWIPAMMRAQVVPERSFRSWNVTMIGRLMPNADTRQAQAASEVLFQRVRAELSGVKPGSPSFQEFLKYRITFESTAAGYSPQREKFTQPIVILSVIVGLVLLIACANISNLLLARSTARRREMAIRLAIGAGRARIIRQLLTESLLLAAMGGVVGVLFAWWGTGVLASIVRSGPVGFNAPAMSLDVDLRPSASALVFTGVLCLVTGILFGLAPALRTVRLSVAQSFEGRGVSSGGARLGKALVIAQVAASLLLLSVAGLFVRTLQSLKSQDLGLDRKHIMLIWTAPTQTGRTGAPVASLFDKTQRRLQSLPGVQSASASVYGFLNGNSFVGADVKVQGYVPQTAAPAVAQIDIVLPGYFDTLGMRLLAGRDFTLHDSEKAPRVVVVNHSLARHFFPNGDAIGKRIGFGGNATGNEYEIVGVVSDAKHITPRDQGRMMHYKPYRQDLGHLLQMCVAVRTVGDPARAANRIRQELRDMDPTLPVVKIETIGEQLDDLLGPERLVAALSGFLGSLALLLVCVGLYGIMSYNMMRRTAEIGIRMALGATRARVLGMVLRECVLLVIAGTLIGLPLTLLSTRFIASRLFSVGPGDPATIGGAVFIMLVVATAAGWVPARRASRVDPMHALRMD